MRAVRYGLTRDFVRCIEAVLPDGEIVQFSSNVVKNTTGYDVKDLVIGSEGTLCILTEVTLKLMPAPKFTRTLVMPFESLESCIDMVPRLLQMAAVPTAIEFLERELAQGEELLAHLGRSGTDGARKRAESLINELEETKEAYHALQGID